jgi:hypothetical protein
MNVKIKCKNTCSSTCFPSSGYYFLKNNTFFVTAVIPLENTKRSGHVHLDSGSITLSFIGNPIIVDPGTYTYTRDVAKRYEYRSYAFHNVPWVKEGNLISEQSIGVFNFSYKNKVDIIEFDENKIIFKINYFNSQIIRSIHVDDNLLNVKDSTDGYLYSSYFIHPSIEIEDSIDHHGCILSTREHKVKLLTQNLITVHDYEYSNSYGMFSNAKRIVLEGEGCIQMTIRAQIENR